jgi:hypothetical protein
MPWSMSYARKARPENTTCNLPVCSPVSEDRLSKACMDDGEYGGRLRRKQDGLLRTERAGPVPAPEALGDFELRIRTAPHFPRDAWHIPIERRSCSSTAGNCR